MKKRKNKLFLLSVLLIMILIISLNFSIIFALPADCVPKTCEKDFPGQCIEIWNCDRLLNCQCDPDEYCEIDYTYQESKYKGKCILLCTTPSDCDDDNICTDDNCNSQGRCEHTNNGNPCDDKDPCTINDVCLNEACSGTPITTGECGGKEYYYCDNTDFTCKKAQGNKKNSGGCNKDKLGKSCSNLCAGKSTGDSCQDNSGNFLCCTPPIGTPLCMTEKLAKMLCGTCERPEVHLDTCTINNEKDNQGNLIIEPGEKVTFIALSDSDDCTFKIPNGNGDSTKESGTSINKEIVMNKPGNFVVKCCNEQTLSSEKFSLKNFFTGFAATDEQLSAKCCGSNKQGICTITPPITSPETPQPDQDCPCEYEFAPYEVEELDFNTFLNKYQGDKADAYDAIKSMMNSLNGDPILHKDIKKLENGILEKKILSIEYVKDCNWYIPFFGKPSPKEKKKGILETETKTVYAYILKIPEIGKYALFQQEDYNQYLEPDDLEGIYSLRGEKPCGIMGESSPIKLDTRWYFKGFFSESYPIENAATLDVPFNINKASITAETAYVILSLIPGGSGIIRLDEAQSGSDVACGMGLLALDVLPWFGTVKKIEAGIKGATEVERALNAYGKASNWIRIGGKLADYAALGYASGYAIYSISDGDSIGLNDIPSVITLALVTTSVAGDVKIAIIKGVVRRSHDNFLARLSRAEKVLRKEGLFPKGGLTEAQKKQILKAHFEKGTSTKSRALIDFTTAQKRVLMKSWIVGIPKLSDLSPKMQQALLNPFRKLMRGDVIDLEDEIIEKNLDLFFEPEYFRCGGEAGGLIHIGEGRAIHIVLSGKNPFNEIIIARGGDGSRIEVLPGQSFKTHILVD